MTIFPPRIPRRQHDRKMGMSFVARLLGRGTHSTAPKESASSFSDREPNPSRRASLIEPTEPVIDHAPENRIRHRYLDYSTTYHESPLPPSLLQSAPDAFPPPPDLRPYADPTAWPHSRKRLITWMFGVLAAVSSCNPGAYSSGTDAYIAEWGVTRTSALSGITVWSCSFAIAPMFLAPFSELAGRLPVFVPAGLTFLVSQVAAAVTRSFGGMIFSRVLAGVSSSVFSTMASGVLVDMYEQDDRNTPMAIFAGGTLFGTGFGPVPSGALVQYRGWRWIWYLQIILVGVMVLVMFATYRETRGSVLLSRKAAALNRWYDEVERVMGEQGGEKGEEAGAAGLAGMHTTSVQSEKAERVRWKVKEDEKKTSIWALIKLSLVGPIHLLLTESVVFWFSLWVGFAWLILFMGFEAFPLILKQSHGFDDTQNGAVFAAICVGAMISVPLGIWQGHLARKLSFVPKTPEGRLVLTGLQGILVPISLFWLGWSSFPSTHWIVPVLSAGALTIGVYSTYLAVFNYFSDVYREFASSANAAQSLARNVAGGVVPLFTDQMLKKLTFQGGCSMLGGIAVLLAFVPFVLVRYGEVIRRRSKIANQLANS